MRVLKMKDSWTVFCFSDGSMPNLARPSVDPFRGMVSDTCLPSLGPFLEHRPVSRNITPVSQPRNCGETELSCLALETARRY